MSTHQATVLAGSPRRRIAFATSTRADYGPLRSVIADLAARGDVDVVVLVTGTHLDAHHGHTADEISASDRVMLVEVPVSIGADDPLDRAAWLSEWLTGATSNLLLHRPDMLVLLGDRFETLIAAQAATLVGIPIAHIHGGEKTTGAIDDGIRHAITKLSHVHFPATAAYARRLRQLGEERIFVLGAPGLSSLDREDPLSDAESVAILGRPLERPYVIVTYHPVTAIPEEQSLAGARALRTVLTQRADLDVIVTGVNVDPGFADIAAEFLLLADSAGDRVIVKDSVGQRAYHGLLRGAVACLGNSSSGIVEAPALGTPTVNIGPRQDGRLRARSIIDVPEDASAIADALHLAQDPDVRRAARTQELPYGGPGASARIADTLATIELGGVLAKDFVDCAAVDCPCGDGLHGDGR